MPVLLDAPPRDLGNVLRAARAGDDVVLDFGGALWLAGYRVYSDGDKRSIGVTPLPPDAMRRGFIDAGADEEVDVDAEEAWSREIARRVEELDAGEVTAVPWSEVRRSILRRRETKRPNRSASSR